ncbi:hypothetical protein [Breoghania sp. JC706]|uniref:hypothetical protein n=1 Tax=Breoghania sp. JC706 TaxID=3117732 RepID=UPI003009C606
MSIGGTFNVSRGIWTDPQFPNEPFTKREAWLWLVSEASWKPRTVRVGSKVVELERGQVAASVRFMAGAWQWEPTKVLRFLRALEGAENIATDSATGVKRITICNYELYQTDHGQGATENATPVQQHRNSSATNEKKGESKGINTPLNPPEGESAARPASRRSKDQIAKPESIPEQLWSDFLALRRKHRAPVTATAWAGIEREADKAGLSLSRAVALCCERGWRGFRADWLKPEDLRAGAGANTPEAEQAVTFNGRTYTAQSIKRVVFETLTGVRTWPADKLGPEPGKPGCAIPGAIVAEVRAVIAERSKPKSEIIPFQPRMIA